jgi:hypothetical protein
MPFRNIGRPEAFSWFAEGMKMADFHGKIG